VVMSAMTDSRSAFDGRDDESAGTAEDDDGWEWVMGGLAEGTVTY